MERYFNPADIANLADGTEAERLAQVFAGHLAVYRAAQQIPADVGEITPVPPELAADEVRLPHLLTYAGEEGIREVVMWEKLPRQEAERWLGSELPDQEFIEAHLPDLLELKRMAREGQLDDERYRELRHALVGRYLSSLFVYQHVHLFKGLLDT